MPTPIIPIKNLTTEEVLYGDRVTSYRWEVLVHPRTRRNLSMNPWPYSPGSTADYGSRWSASRVLNFGDVTWTMTLARDSAGVGYDIRGNADIPPGIDGDWISIPMQKGDTIYIGAEMNWNKAVTNQVIFRLHDGAGNWLGAAAGGAPVAVPANTWTRVGAGYTATADGFLVARIQATAGVALVIGDTFKTRLLVMDPGTLVFEGYFDGGFNPMCRWATAPANGSASYPGPSYQVPATDQLLGILDGVSDGGLTWTQNAAVKGGGKATVVDLAAAEAGKLRIGQLSLESVRLRPVCLVAGLPENPLGIFLLSSAVEEWEDTGRVWNISLLDRCTVPSQDAFDQSYSVPAGTLILKQVQTILTTCGEFMPVDASNTLATANGMAWEAGTSKLKVINDLLDVAGYNALWMDGQGNYQATPRVLPADRSINYEVLGIPRELKDGEQAIYQPDWTRDRDSFEVPNKVIAVQAAGGDDAAALVGTWTNTDRNSPYSYQSRGRWIPHVLDSVECPDGTDPQVIAFLQSRARATLVQMSAVQAQVKITNLPIPVRVGDVVRFANTQAGVDARHVITRIELDVTPTGLMRTNLQEVISL
ncbi:minor tail protein [Microbacterium phage Neferthena]|uniref:Minor tail protein n=1 Tax=Microbacterium phage Neferthena TaxID=2301539 RepID=A0A385D4G3_9CAUD|nr:minor tail protein [Microbacterium phage Neferthena]AXQ52884.1 minor tail protein [Microbacterium phage Neferthena]